MGCSNSTLQHYRHDINMLSPFRIPLNSSKRKQKISNREHDLEKLSTNDLKRPQLTSKESTNEVNKSPKN